MDYLIKLGPDGNGFIALIGENLQEGIAGCGDTAPDALRNLADELELLGGL
jgi:hypothetical protein